MKHRCHSPVGDRVRQLRRQRKWTQAQLADRCGGTRGQIAHVERGESYPSWDLLLHLAAAFELTVANMLRGVTA